jgi:methyl-accepting chemotaxis protein
MLNQLLQSFDGLNSEKILESVNHVINNRDKIINLVEKLPKLLQDTGDTIEAAGQSAVRASLVLTGDGKTQGGVDDLAQLAASALDRCQKELQSVAGTMNHLGQEIDDIRIPSVQPKFIEVVGLKVVGGLEFGESQLVDNAAERLKQESKRLEQIGDDLLTVATQLRELGKAMNQTGRDLNGVGQKLEQGGRTLRSMID